jgi:FixJ family two-component response regulator
MPKMSGSDLARALHRDYPGLPVVYMTGYAEPDFAVADGEVVIAKPFTEVALLEAVASALPDDRPWPRGGAG